MFCMPRLKSLSGLIVLGLDFSLSFFVILALAIVGLQEEETFLEQSISDPLLGDFNCN